MTQDEAQSFHDELKAVVKKHGVTGAAFCGRHDDDFIGFAVDDMTATDYFEMTLNVGRLWQHIRTGVRDILNDFEGRDRK